MSQEHCSIVTSRDREKFKEDASFIEAIERNDTATVQQQLEAGLPPEGRDYKFYYDSDNRPLNVAIHHERLEIIKLLFQYNVHCLTSVFNQNDLQFAAGTGNLPIFKFILDQNERFWMKPFDLR